MRVIRILSLATLVFFFGCNEDEPNDFGRFENSTKVEFIRGAPNERRVRLLEELRYVDPSGQTWIAPKDYVSDGASIPRAFWTVVGGPLDGPYREAAIIHDAYCDSKSEPHQDVHRIFYYANRAVGVSKRKSKILYTAVKIGGPKWSEGPSNCYASCHSVLDDYQFDEAGRLYKTPSVSEEDVRKVTAWIDTNDPTLTEIDEYVAEHHAGSAFGHAAIGVVDPE